MNPVASLSPVYSIPAFSDDFGQAGPGKIGEVQRSAKSAGPNASRENHVCERRRAAQAAEYIVSPVAREIRIDGPRGIDP